VNAVEAQREDFRAKYGHTLSGHEIAGVFKVASSTAYGWMSNGVLPTVVLGERTVRVPRHAVEALLFGDGSEE
jgi:hypothetical protein